MLPIIHLNLVYLNILVSFFCLFYQQNTIYEFVFNYTFLYLLIFVEFVFVGN